MNMKIECLRDTLKNTLTSLEKVVGRNLSLPVLSGVYFLANKKNNSLLIRATNLDLGIEATIPAKIEEGGEIVVPPSVLIGILSGMYDKKATLEIKQGNLTVSSISAESIVNGIQNDGFPTLPVIQGGTEINIPVQTLVDGVKSVWYSSSVSDIKPEIASVYIYNKNDSVVFVSTDSFRLAEKSLLIKGGEKEFHLLVPYKNIVEVVRIFDGISGSVRIHFNKNQVAFSSGDIYITSRLIDGIFPDYNQIIPKSHTTSVVVMKQDLINALKVANIFADKFNRVDISVDPRKKLFELRSHNANIGENVSKIDAVIDGEKISLGFNHKYILDCFQSIKQESAMLTFAGEGKPLIIQGKGDKTFLYLVMPLTM